MSKRGKITIFILLLLTIVFGVTLALSSNPESKIHSFYKVVSAPVSGIQNFFSTLGREMGSRLSVFSSYQEIKDEIDFLREENDRLSADAAEKDRLERENEELRALLGLKEYYQNYRLAAANVIAGDFTDWYNEFTIDCGSSDGVTVGCPVVTSKGLVGIVSVVGPFSSKVLSIADEQNVIMARIVRSNELVMLRGVTTENLEYYLRLERIGANSSLYVGDVLVTAESGGVFPKGLTIGTVTEISTQADTELRYAVVEPAVSLPSVSEVFVLIDQTAEPTQQAEETPSN